MAPLCPGPCGRLTTAATFVCIAVIQVIAGLILLKSQFVYMLSAPNFWTAASNLSVGCLMGVSATVWKDISKRTSKHTTRRNVLYALAGSATVLNAVTAAILILSEGNTLLSIHLENNNRRSSKVLASEILAYAYATSVCSPVVAVVVSIVYLSGIFTRNNDEDGDVPHLKRILKLDDSYPYDWVYENKLGAVIKPSKKVLNPALSLQYSRTFEETPNVERKVLRSNSISAHRYLDSPYNTGNRRLADESTLKYSDIENTPMYTPISRLCVSFADSSDGINKFLQKGQRGSEMGIVEDSPFCLSSVENETLFPNPVQQLKRQGALKRIGWKENVCENKNVPYDLNNSSNFQFHFEGNQCEELEESNNLDGSGKKSNFSEVFYEDSSNVVRDTILSDIFDQCGDVSTSSPEIRKTSADESHLLNISGESRKSQSAESKFNRDHLPIIRVHTNPETIAGKIVKTQDIHEGEHVKHPSGSYQLHHNLAGQVVAVQLDRSKSRSKSSKLIPVSVPVLDGKLSKLKGKGFRQSMRVDPAELDKRGVSFASFSRKKFDCKKMTDSAMRGTSNSSSDCFLSPQTSDYGSTLDESIPGTSGVGQNTVHQKISQANEMPDKLTTRQREASKQDMIEELNLALLNLKEKMGETSISDLINEAAFYQALKNTLQEENS